MRWIISLIFMIWPQLLAAGEVTLAVASNFIETAEEIAGEFESETGHEVILVHGSSGQIFAQISNGAPFDIFLSADAERPARAVEDGLAVEAKTYAMGRLALISRGPFDPELAQDTFAGETVALADPTVAPYGLAATQAMEKLELDTATFQPVLVANVGQVATVFATGNANLAFVSEAQVEKISPPFALALTGFFAPIMQDAALLNRGAENQAAQQMWAFLFSEKARRIIASHNYDLR